MPVTGKPEERHLTLGWRESLYLAESSNACDWHETQNKSDWQQKGLRR